jgi:hypothetical protein
VARRCRNGALSVNQQAPVSVVLQANEVVVNVRPAVPVWILTNSCSQHLDHLLHQGVSVCPSKGQRPFDVVQTSPPGIRLTAETWDVANALLLGCAEVMRGNRRTEPSRPRVNQAPEVSTTIAVQLNEMVASTERPKMPWG